MPITYQVVKDVAAALYERSLRRIPPDAMAALRAAQLTETNDVARQTLLTMVTSAEQAAATNHFVCSDAGIPTYFVRIGTQLTLDGDLKQAITDGFADLVQTIQPPLLMHVTNPLTNERGYAGKDVPIVSFDVLGGADYVEIVCSPKALGSGRWAALKVFSFPSLDDIEAYVMECVIEAGSQPCPPVVVGVGIGGSFDHAARMAKEATLRPVGQRHPEPMVADMEARLLDAVNATGFGPMGTGGDTTAMAVNVEYSAGHGFTPVAVCFNCWINRRTSAKMYDDGRVERFDV